ncbi:unnamed protein product [Sphenostylis stenocarpa]|uniref:Uncharacterized protein n=1 Tax=Sphenostylis stenocarpa TaxID=92480 RepID=A0AA86V7T0_9FABA|nr:unnamed protein product [Sphenostylis stenocarpa]
MEARAHGRREGGRAGIEIEVHGSEFWGVGQSDGSWRRGEREERRPAEVIGAKVDSELLGEATVVIGGKGRDDGDGRVEVVAYVYAVSVMAILGKKCGLVAVLVRRNGR